MPNFKEFLAYLVFTIGLLGVGALVAGYIYGLGRLIAYTDTLPYRGWVTIAFVGGCMIIGWILEKIYDAIEDRLAARATRKSFGDHLRHF